MSLQLRLTLVYILLGGPVLAVFGAVVYLLVRGHIYDGVDSALVNRSSAVAASISHAAGVISENDIGMSRASLDKLATEGDPFQILDRDGRILYSSLADQAPLAIGTGAPAAGFTTDNLAGERVRISSTPIERIGEVVGFVQARASLAAADSAAASVLTTLIAGGVVALVAATFPAYLIAGRALRPVRDVSRLAREVEATADFARRLPPARSAGDLEELTTTFNALIGRVERLIDTQRQFLADSSHELRRPLSILATDIDVVGDPSLSPVERADIEAEMRSEIDAMKRLITDLLVLAREGSDRQLHEPVDLSALCARTLRKAKAEHPGHRFVSEIDQEISLVGDSARLEQVLENLLQNAGSYTPPGSTVSLVLGRLGGSIRLTVRDDGPGMTEEDQAAAFDRFYRGSAARRTRASGLGLGLAIVKHISEAHGGSVSVVSSPGRGTCFTIEFPETDFPTAG